MFLKLKLEAFHKTQLFNTIALRMAKTIGSFGHSERNYGDNKMFVNIMSCPLLLYMYLLSFILADMFCMDLLEAYQCSK